MRLQRIRVVAGIRASRRARLARGGARRSAALPAALLAIGVAAAACDRPSADSVGHVAATRAPVYVDSILPIEEELRRFRAGLEERPRQLTGEWTSRESLVRHFIERLEAADTAAFPEMLITRAEFAELYYPESPFASPPYELGPHLVWYQMVNRISRGLGRLLRGFAGREVGYRLHRCDPEPEVHGESRVWTNCTVTLRPPGTEEDVRLRLFGNVLERDGRFKFLTYANNL